MVVLEVMLLMFCVLCKGACPLSCFNRCLKLNHCYGGVQAVNAACGVGSKANLVVGK